MDDCEDTVEAYCILGVANVNGKGRCNSQRSHFGLKSPTWG